MYCKNWNFLIQKSALLQKKEKFLQLVDHERPWLLSSEKQYPINTTFIENKMECDENLFLYCSSVYSNCIKESTSEFGMW